VDIHHRCRRNCCTANGDFDDSYQRSYGVPISQVITATFSTAMTPATITNPEPLR